MHKDELKAIIDAEAYELLKALAAYFRDEGFRIKKHRAEDQYQNVMVVRYSLIKPRWIRKDIVYFRLNVPLENTTRGWRLHSHTGWICGLDEEIFANDRMRHELQRKIDHWKTTTKLEPHDILVDKLLQGSGRYSVS